jgi:hypothetical protein
MIITVNRKRLMMAGQAIATVGSDGKLRWLIGVKPEIGME